MAKRRGFTLVELLVVVGIIAILLAILLPTIARAQRSARRAACMSNLRQIGVAIFNYADESGGYIPYGPTAPQFSPTNFYPGTGYVTSLISLESGGTVGLSLMLNRQLASSKKVLFCPDVDQDYWADKELALVGIGQAQCDYYYRHASGGGAPPSNGVIYPPSDTLHLRLSSLGANSLGLPIRALAMDVNFLTVPGLAAFGAPTRTCHNQQSVNVLYSDGHVSEQDNHQGDFTVIAKSPTQLQFTFAAILSVFETADDPALAKAKRNGP